MTPPPLAAVVMAAGLGTRMRSETPKHFHPLLGRRMVDWVLDAVRPLGPDPLLVVTAPGYEDRFDGVQVAVQTSPRGTGDAVAAARGALSAFDGDVLVLAGDSPLVTPGLLEELIHEHRRQGSAVTLVSFEPGDPRPYGRIVRAGDGTPLKVVEAADATEEELAIGELNASIYVFRAADLWTAIEGLGEHNVQGELYLTDTIGLVADLGRPVAVHNAGGAVDPEGVNTRADLAFAACILRDRVNERHMLAGVTIVDPGSTWIDAGVTIEADAVIHPFTVIRGETSVARGAEIGPHAVLVDVKVGARALVGPFCYLRPGTVLELGSKAGSFVEIKNSHVGEGAKVPHLSYIGDAEIGAGANVAAGNITGNYPHEEGRPKQRTRIGRNVRTGIHNGFIAPVTIGDGAWTAAGSVITDDVPADSLAIARARQVNKEGYVARKRDDG